MFDVKQASAVSGQAQSNLKEQVADAQALADVFAGLDEEQQKILATQLELGDSFKASKESITDMKESISKIPSISKTIQGIQEKTGKSYKQSLDSLKKSLESTKKQNKETRQLLISVKSLEESYKKTALDIDRGTKSLKEFGKTQQEIDKRKKRELQAQQEMIRKIGSNLKTIFGGGGAAGIGGMLHGASGISGAVMSRMLNSNIAAMTDKMVDKKWIKQETGEKIQRKFKTGGKLVGGLVESIIDAAMYEFEISFRQSKLNTRMAALGAPAVSLRQPELTREEVDKYSSQMAARGIMPTPKALQNYAANSKRFGDEINANITEKMIVASGTIENSWKHINVLAETFRDTAKEAGVPMLDLMKWTADTAVQARFLNIDTKTVAQTYKVLTDNMKTFSKVGITRDMLPGIATRMLTTMKAAPIPMRAFWASQINMPGSLEERVQKMSLGGKTLQRSGAGYNVAGEEDPQIYIKVLEAMRAKMAPLGLTGALAAAPTMLPGFTEKDVIALLTGKFDALKDKLEEPIVAEEKQAQYLKQLVDMEYKQQQFRDAITGLLLEIASKGTMDDTLTAARKSWAVAQSLTTEVIERSQRRRAEEAKKHTGGVIPKGTVSEVLTKESFKGLGRDSFYAFNPSHDVYIGSPQTTKNETGKRASFASSSERKLDVNINVNGSIITDQFLLSKIEELFARRMDLI
jgi:hypothetical protein